MFYFLLLKLHLGIDNLLNIPLWEFVELIIQDVIWYLLKPRERKSQLGFKAYFHMHHTLGADK